MRYKTASRTARKLVIFLFTPCIVSAETSPNEEKSFSPPKLNPISAFQESTLSENHSVNWKDFSLKICLEINYEKLGAYKSGSLKDYTTISPPISPQQSIKLVKYIENKAGNFHKENLPIDSELTPPPYNAIFARCINFHNSKELHKYLTKLKSEEK